MSSIKLSTGEIIENVKLVIFDKDGTLIDVHHYWCSMIDFRAKFFSQMLEGKIIDTASLYQELVDNMGIDLKSKKMKPEGPVGIKPRSYIVEVVLETIRKYYPAFTKEEVIDIFAQVDEYSMSQLKKIVTPLSGVKEFLEALNEANIKCVIATTDLTNRAQIAMYEIGLSKYFVEIAGADKVERAKPYPDLVEYLLDKTGFNVDDAIVVGDSMADLGMASNAKCKFLGIKSGLYTDEFVKSSLFLVSELTQVKVEV